jgi:hypothetical protein
MDEVDEMDFVDLKARPQPLDVPPLRGSIHWPTVYHPSRAHGGGLRNSALRAGAFGRIAQSGQTPGSFGIAHFQTLVYPPPCLWQA